MKVISLLDGGFDVGRQDHLAFSELPNTFDEALVTDFADVDGNAA